MKSFRITQSINDIDIVEKKELTVEPVTVTINCIIKSAEK